MNLYDFTDVSDLSDNLKGRLTAGGGRTNPLVAVYLDIVVKARSDGGIEVINISQVEAIAERMGLTPKSQQAIRGALNVSVTAGALTKPSRQTYAVAGVAGLEKTTSPTVEAPIPASEDSNAVDADPLAD